MYTAGIFAKKANVSLKTIHHYDSEGLLKPSSYTQAGYRLYTDKDFEKLQKILTLKFLGFSLDEIKWIISQESDQHNFQQSLMIQQHLLKNKLKHLTLIKEAIDQLMTLKQEDESYWSQIMHLIDVIQDEQLGVSQYENSSNLCDRIYLHDAFSTNKIGWHRWFFEQMHLTENLKILELGCGAGTLWHRNQHDIPKQCEISLTDLSEGMLNDASRQLKTCSPSFEFKVMDAQRIEYEDHTFDVVIADHVFYLIENKEQAIAEIFRVLKPGGRLFLTTLGKQHMMELKQLVQEFDSSLYLSKIDYAEEFGLELASDVLASYFGEIQSKIYPDSLAVTEEQALVNYLLSCPGNIKTSLTSEKLTAFKQYVSNRFEPDHLFHITKQTGVITAIKPHKQLETQKHDHCLICDRISLIETHQNPYFVAELETGYVVIGDHQYFKGYTLFLCKQHKTELYELDDEFKLKFLHEMSLVAEAMAHAFSFTKLNYELLGNGDSHMHWHLFPRREEDDVRGPVWWLDRDLMFSESTQPTDEHLREMKLQLYRALEKLTPILSKGEC